MIEIKHIAVDTSKSVVTIHAVDLQDRPVIRRDLKRAQFEAFFLAYPVNAYTHYMWGCQWQTLRKSSLEGIVHFECRVVQKQRWELSFEVAQYVVWGRRIEDHVLACRFVWATTESAQETNRRGWVRRNDPFQRNAFFG